MKLVQLLMLLELTLILTFLPLNCVAAENTDLKIKLNIYEPTGNKDTLDYTKDILPVGS